MLRGALIGFGEVAENAHAPAWKNREDFRILAVAEERPERARRAKETFPDARVYDDAETLLRQEAPDLDFIDIATPPHLHHPHILLGLRHRCHVLSEKPLVLQSEQLREIQSEARTQDRAVFCVHNWAYAPPFRQALRWIRTGAIGNVRHIQLHTLRSAPAVDASSTSWRIDPRKSGGGILVDHGWHSFYLLQRLAAQEPTAIAARLALRPDGGVEEEALCTVEFPGASGVIYLSWRSPRRANWGVVYGDTGSIELLDDRIFLRRGSGDLETIEFPQKLSAGSAHPGWFEAMLDDFKSEALCPELRHDNLREADRCLSLLALGYESHRLGGRPMELPREAVNA